MKTDLPYIIFELTPDCNLNCRYCYNIWKRPGEHTSVKNSYKTARRTLKKLFSLTSIENVTFTGGEPFISERFAELVLFCRMKKKTVTIISNGTYASEEDYKTMISLGVNLFEIPVHSSVPEQHDYMAATKGAWEKSQQTIKYIKASGGVVVAVIVLTKANYKNIKETLIFIKSLGINNIMLNRFNIGGKGISESPNLLLTGEEMRETFKIANSVAGEYELSVTSNVCTPFCILNPDDYPNIPISSCSASIYNKPVTLEINGNLRVCNHSPVVIGNIYNNSMEEIFSSEYVKSWGSIIPDYCKDCPIWAKCLGGCRAASEQMGFGLDRVDPIVSMPA